MSPLATHPVAEPRGEVTHAATRPEGLRFMDKLEAVYDKLSSMETWADGWNGYAARAPTQAAIEKARGWISQMYAEVESSGQPWRDPFVTADVDGEVVFEWWTKTKSLSIYVDENETTHIRDLGPEVGSEMQDGDASTTVARSSLWKWFTG